jgi:hypothetical protein
MNEKYVGYEPQSFRLPSHKVQPMDSQCLSDAKQVSVDVFENPPEPSSALKDLIGAFKNTFKEDAAWDGKFVL